MPALAISVSKIFWITSCLTMPGSAALRLSAVTPSGILPFGNIFMTSATSMSFVIFSPLTSATTAGTTAKRSSGLVSAGLTVSAALAASAGLPVSAFLASSAADAAKPPQIMLPATRSAIILLLSILFLLL